MAEKTFYLEGAMIRVTNKAALIRPLEVEQENGSVRRIDDPDLELWFPMSQMTQLGQDIFHYAPGEVFEVHFPEWLIRDKGLFL